MEAVRKARTETLREARLEAIEHGRSLVPIDEAARRIQQRYAEAEQWGRVHLHIRSGGGYRISSGDGYGAGRRDGAGIYGNGHRRLGAGTPSIGPGRQS
jgi:hypothetical protein